MKILKLIHECTIVARNIIDDFIEVPAAILAADPAARNKREIIFLYPGFRALVSHRVSHALWQNRAAFAARACSEFTRFHTGIEIHPGAALGRRVVIDHGMGTVIGETAVVKDDVVLYQGVTLGSTQNTKSKRHPTIENGATIGVGASVLGDISIGARAKVGAGAVVLKSVDSLESVGGIPAQILKKTHNLRSIPVRS